MKKDNLLKWGGLGLGIAGAAISVLSGIVSDKKTDSIISEKVAKEVAKQTKEV